MEEQVRDLDKELQAEFGPRVKARFQNVFALGKEDYPEVKALIQEGSVRLPVVLLNGEPYFHGGVSLPHIQKAVQELQEEE